MRILWHGVAPWANSGYGVSSMNLLPRFKKMGHEVICFTVYGLQGGRLNWNGIDIWPVKRAQYGTDCIGSYAAEMQADMVITLFDQWVMPQVQDVLKNLWVPYVVLHYEPMEEPLKIAVKKTEYQLTLCEWATNVLKEEELNPYTIPLGVDTKLYQPLFGKMSGGEFVTQADCKHTWGLESDQFVIGMVAANRDFRKQLEPQLRVFADFHKKYPEARLLFHTNPSQDEGGWDLVRLIKRLGCEEYIHMTASSGTELLPEEMRTLYNSMDVFMNCSASEGYGLPIIEAQACGTPVIVNDFSAMAEIGGVGWRLPCKRFVTPMYSYGAALDENALFKALEESLGEAPKLREKARRHALKYDWDYIVESYWKPFFEKWTLEHEL